MLVSKPNWTKNQNFGLGFEGLISISVLKIWSRLTSLQNRNTQITGTTLPVTQPSISKQGRTNYSDGKSRTGLVFS